MTTASTTAPGVAISQRPGTHGQILKSSALIGGASVINLGFAMVRSKAMAMLLGPEGVGLFGLFNSILDFVRSVAGMGINNSGVRQIAEAVGTQDRQVIARTVITLRRVAFVTGALGALVLLVFCKPVAQLTFGNSRHAGSVALLAVAVLFADVSAGQFALLQGLRRISDLARISIIGGFFGTALTIPIIYFLRQDGVVPSLVVVASGSILTSWWYARRVKVEAVPMRFKEVLEQSSALLKLGFVFMASSLMATAVPYLVRVLVTHQLGLQAAGFYQAAWVIGGLYFGFIVQAMGTDFYPRLTAVARDNAECNRLINEQAEVGLLLAGPGIFGTLALAPLVIPLFYSAKFGPAVDILRWISLGMLLRIVVWPMAFIMLAKAAGKLFFWSELVANAIQVVLLYGAVAMFGLPGTGIAFFLLYVIYGIGVYVIARRMCGFRLSTANRRLSLSLGSLLLAVFVGGFLLPPLWGAVLGLLATGWSTFYSVRTLCRLVSVERLPRPVLTVLAWLRLTPGAS